MGAAILYLVSVSYSIRASRAETHERRIDRRLHAITLALWAIAFLLWAMVDP